MGANVSLDHVSGTTAVLGCLGLATGFVGSLYLVDVDLPRNHPRTIKRRFAAVVGASALSCACVYSLTREEANGRPLLTLLGCDPTGALSLAVGPLLLNLVLYLGPILQTSWDGWTETYGYMIDGEQSIRESFRDIVWAPVSEEFVFRACMIPLLVPAFGSTGAGLLAPLFFGVAHLHHLLKGEDLQVVVAQFVYTTLFGWYSAYLFVRTGHIVGPLACHMLCNFMGLPAFGSIGHSRYPRALKAAYVFGLVAFACLLKPLSDPGFYRAASVAH